MYLWYRMSAICVAYLEDVVHYHGNSIAEDEDGGDGAGGRRGKVFEESEWFNRGWTLQELIAPRDVAFFDGDWKFLGTKMDLLEIIEEKTNVPREVLSNEIGPDQCSVAQRMSWAANRITKRVEDRGYSLLGLFDVNMAMIYGEREKAFLRLQQHIIQKCRDESIFAWAMDDSMGEYWSIYAPSPSFFGRSSDIVPIPGSDGFSERNGELSINLPVRSCSPSECKALLNCTSEFHPDSRFYIITTITQDSNGYVRVRDSEGKSEGLISAHSIRDYHPTLLRFPIDPRRPPDPIFYGFWLRTLQPPGHDETTPMILSSAEPPEPDHVRQTNRRAITGIVHFKAQE